MSPIQNGEPSNARAALMASVDRMRRRKDSEKPVVIASTSSTVVIRNSISRRQNAVTPYCTSKATCSPSRSKRAEPTTTRQKNIRTAAGVKSRSTTPSSASSSAPGTPSQQIPPRFPTLSTDSCVLSSIVDSYSMFCSDTRTHIAHFEAASCNLWAMRKEALDPPDVDSLESENEEILREMFAKYTNFDMSGSEVS